MNSMAKQSIFVVDDDKDTLNLIETFLTTSGYDVITADSGHKALELLKNIKPALILLDVMMPEMDGYDLCYRLQQHSSTAFIPVVFVTALKKEQNKAKAFALGAVGYLVKPIRKEILIENIQHHLRQNSQWKTFRQDSIKTHVSITSSNFIKFKDFLADELHLSPEREYKLDDITHSTIYTISSEIGIGNEQMAQYIADFLKIPYTPTINMDNVELGILPAPFCRTNLIVAVRVEDEEPTFVLSDPFNLEVIDILEKFNTQGKILKIAITQPENIKMILETRKIADNENLKMDTGKEDGKEIPETSEQMESERKYAVDTNNQSTLNIANKILFAAASERASDIHIELKKKNCIVRFRVDGDMRDMFTLEKKTGFMLISRFKAIGGMDIAERRRPQDGTLEAMIDNLNFKLRLATTSTPEGENIVIRMLQPYAKPKKLNELGMTEDQANIMMDVINRTHGLILVVGPTGSGKTTTVYSLLSHLECKIRNLVSIEDPVEYRMPFANQQQVNAKAGVTFETLLKSIVRLDPDVIFLGEIRDQYSAKMAMDFASTGHLTLTTLHTTNTTTAVFRLERLGIDRSVMADAVLCVVAQRLAKKLCPHCKNIAKISREEINMLKQFTDEIPDQVANPVGCSKCFNTGYLGREGLYEILKFDTGIAQMVRSGKSISEIRKFFQKRGIYLIGNHAIEKVKEYVFSPKDVYQNVLVEDIELLESGVKS